MHSIMEPPCGAQDLTPYSEFFYILLQEKDIFLSWYFIGLDYNSGGYVLFILLFMFNLLAYRI